MHMIAKVLAGAALAALVAPAWGQDYPVREIRSICNFAAGSGADIIVRYYSDRLSRLAGKPVLVENKPGAKLQIERISRAGYSWLFAGRAASAAQSRMSPLAFMFFSP